MGHYLYCRYYRVDATLPFFIPFPLGFGTLGAFIRIRAPFPTGRRSSTSGPPVPSPASSSACPCSISASAKPCSLPIASPGESLSLGEPLLFQVAARSMLGAIPDGNDAVDRAPGSRRLVRHVHDRPQPDAHRAARRRPRHLLPAAAVGLHDLPRRLLGVRRAHLLRTELDRLVDPAPRAGPSSPADRERRRPRRTRPGVAGPLGPRRLRPLLRPEPDRLLLVRRLRRLPPAPSHHADGVYVHGHPGQRVSP